MSHRVGKQVTGKHKQIIVKFVTRNIRERVFRAKSDLKSVNQQNEDKPKIYINEDLTQFRAGLAREARSYRASGLVSDTWTIYGKVMIKDNFGRVRIIKTYDDLFRYKQTTGRYVNAESGEQSTTDRRWTQFSGRLENVYLSGKTCLLIQKSGITASCALSLYLVTWHIYTNRSTSHLVINYFHAIFISVCPYIFEYMYIQWGAVNFLSMSHKISCPLGWAMGCDL